MTFELRKEFFMGLFLVTYNLDSFMTYLAVHTGLGVEMNPLLASYNALGIVLVRSAILIVLMLVLAKSIISWRVYNVMGLFYGFLCIRNALEFVI